MADAYQVGPLALGFEAGSDPDLAEHARASLIGRDVDALPDVTFTLKRDSTIVGGPREPCAHRDAAGHAVSYFGWRGSFDGTHALGRFAVGAPPSLDRKRVESLTRVVLGLSLLPRGGLSFHATALVDRGLGYLFVGPSGAGKTTIARVWPADGVLSDDHALVVRDDASPSQFTVFGTPYSGRERTPCIAGSAPLAAILVLQQDVSPRAEVLSRPEAIRELIGNVIHVSDSPADASSVLAVLDALTVAVPVARLHFGLNISIWPSAREVPRCTTRH